MIGNNYHTHTCFCDGKNTPEELVLKAISLGCREIGFSGHSYTDIPDEHPFCMSPENTKKYKAEILRLKMKYKDKISVLLGVERDYFSECDTSDYDYVIGSVHYVLKNGFYISVDDTEEILINAVNTYYGGDFYAFAEDYYELVGNIFEKTCCDIVGHFDLVSKYNGKNRLFNPKNERYMAAADKALNRLLGKGLYFEINYGAVQRGLRTNPYPEERIIKKLLQNGEKIIYSSDCHDKEYLLYGIEKENFFILPDKKK